LIASGDRDDGGRGRWWWGWHDAVVVRVERLKPLERHPDVMTEIGTPDRKPPDGCPSVFYILVYGGKAKYKLRIALLLEVYA
jgi:hypothetical protein